MFAIVDESAVKVGDVLLMFETGPWGTARVTDIGAEDEHGYRIAKLRRPFLYGPGCNNEGEPGIEDYSIFLKQGRTVKRFVRS